MKELLENLSEMELIHCYSEIVSKLYEKGIIRTKNISGEFDERFVIDHYKKTSTLPNLQRTQTGTKNIDATSRKGERYSIKTITGSNTTTSVIYGDLREDKPLFEYLIIIHLDNKYLSDLILELTWKSACNNKKWHKTMKGYNFRVGEKLMKDAKIIYDNRNS